MKGLSLGPCKATATLSRHSIAGTGWDIKVIISNKTTILIALVDQGCDKAVSYVCSYRKIVKTFLA